LAGRVLVGEKVASEAEEKGGGDGEGEEVAFWGSGSGRERGGG